MAEGRDTGSETGRIGVEAERTDIREEMGVIPDAMGIHQTPHTPKKDISVDKTGTEVGQCEHVLLGAGKINGTQ